MKRRVIALAAVVMLLMTGCQVLKGGNINDNPDVGARQEQLDVLRKRPDIEQVTRTYQQLVSAIQQATIERFDLPEWAFDSRDEISNAACGFEFPDIGLRDGGRTRGIGGGASEAKISDGKWQEALDVVAQLAREQGFTKGPGVLIDRPGDHMVEFYDAYGGYLTFGTKKATIVSIRTGCHLTPEAHGGGGPDANAPVWPPTATSSLHDGDGETG